VERSQTSFDLSRRTALKAGSAAALATLVEGLAWIPKRPAVAATELPDIQLEAAQFIKPATAINGVQVQFGPVHTYFETANLRRAPTLADQTTRRRSTCRPSSRSTRSRAAWNGSSPRPGGRTSSARPDAIGPSRWSS
jgi:hypothetical protein